jgi:hypothetical protein
MSVTTVYELPHGSPRWAVTIRSPRHVGQHRFYTEGEAEDFRQRAVAPPDSFDATVAEANAALDSGEAHRCILALAALTAAVEARQMVEGRL